MSTPDGLPPPQPPRATPPAPPAGTGEPPRPTAKAERIGTLDVLRGFALLGILLVNIELFRGSDLYTVMVGETPQRSGSDQVVDALVGWLVSGKFVSSFALLFGIGAAIIAGRATARGRSPRPLLARRYGVLLLFGLAHMFLLFPGDILFHYALVGFVLLAFVTTRPRVLLGWAIGLLALMLVAMLGFAGLAVAADGFADPAADDAFTTAFDRFIEDRRDSAVTAYTEGGLGEQLRTRAWEAMLVQSGQLFLIPWTLAMFLLGFALWRSGALTDDARRRRLFRRAAAIALPVGLVANLPMGAAGALGGAMMGTDGGLGSMILLVAVSQSVGAPILAVGYLAALGLACERPGVVARLAPLRDAGRMALTSYLLQSLLATAFFTGLRFYDQLSATQALGVVAGIWIVMLVVASLVMRRFERGPVEALWRRLTYGA